ncbi:sigma-54 interaction domain-containing protein [Aurantiacibacter poecillastricola]|uniref:sigma-54 interaction domain-containing protein n=1 Tax=Aurantiacibacter poecillastricola TaxID=3064385 RepID=UPI00273F8B09|nr:sigma 54-interacting transcriptional regulator [Aurantiacibacter sp. 219JJ12-13]MDP5263123.1 sigma 54-interacting transcriptional regulator [Aurantiacibacter sp. 219JJ12-13]
MADFATAALSAMPGSGELQLCEAGNDVQARRRNDRLIMLEHGESPSLARRGANMVHLRYDDAHAAMTRAAILAAATEQGDPIVADTGSLALMMLAERVAASTIPVLIEGPTGTGKEVLSRFIHKASARAEGPFVAVNCAAMPEAMLEALLFGHRKGAFTGATEASEGFFRAAGGGTLLLDELGEMPLGLQAKLLRALQEGEVVPLGATQPVKVDVRVIACTNRDLPREIAEGRFREDLYYRLNVFPLRLTALRERTEDIAPLAAALLLRHAHDPARGWWIDDAALARLEAHKWPGNVRELENVIRRALLLAGDETTIMPEHIVFDHAASPVMTAAASPAQIPGARGRNLSAIVRQSEAQVILDTLDDNHGNRGATAKALGISERTLRYRLASLRDAGLLAVAGGAR